MEDPSLQPPTEPVKEPVNATWYAMDVEIPFQNETKSKTDQSRVSYYMYHINSIIKSWAYFVINIKLFYSNIFESCFVSQVKVKSIDAGRFIEGEPMNLTSQALVGIIVKEDDEGLHESNDKREMQKKMAIFICDDDFDADFGEEEKITRFVK